MQREKTGQMAFTLIEIVIVMVILGILATIILPRVGSRPQQARRLKAVLQIQYLQTALESFHADNGFYPSTEQGLEALVEKPAIGKVPARWPEHGYLSGRVPRDPWGFQFIYISPGTHGNEYEMVSYGSDGAEGGEGWDRDIQSWRLEEESM